MEVFKEGEFTALDHDQSGLAVRFTRLAIVSWEVTDFH